MSIRNFETYSYTGKYQLSVKDNLESLIKDLKDEDYSLIIIDSKISKNFREIEKSLNFKKIIVDVNAKTKSIDKLVKYLELFSNLNLKRSDKILVIGGATIQDIFGTVCCLYHRGIKWTFVPTILAQGDSCIGSKTHWMALERKINLVFYPPSKFLFVEIFYQLCPILKFFLVSEIYPLFTLMKKVMIF